jgi:hypothetical protein
MRIVVQRYPSGVTVDGEMSNCQNGQARYPALVRVARARYHYRRELPLKTLGV